MRHLLVVRLDALGDTLLCTPALAALGQAHPETRLTVLTRPAGTRVVQGLAQAVEVTGNPVPVARTLAPDAVLVFTEKRAGIMAAFRSGARQRAGFDPGLSQPLKSAWLKVALTHRLAYPNDLSQDPGLHEVERYWRLASLLAGPLPEPGPLRLEIPEEALREGRAWLAERFDRAPVGVQLTPKWGLPAEFFEALVARLEGPVLAFYGPAEESWALGLVERCGVTACFRPSLEGYAAVLAGCRQLVTVDTGAVHVAAALGVPVVDVFPEKHHAHCQRRWSPWRVPHRMLLHGPRLLEELVEASRSF